MSVSDRGTFEQGSYETGGGGPGPVTPGRSEQLQAVTEELELVSADGGTVPPELMDRYQRLLFHEIRLEPADRLLWPDDLYIPSEADFRTYWPVAPPDSNRYSENWAAQTGGGPTSCYARRTDGRLYANVNISGLNPSGFIGWAGVAATFVPTAQLSIVEVSTTIDLVNQSRWWYLPGPTAGYSRVDYNATVTLGVWRLDMGEPWPRVGPFASRTILHTSQIGQGGFAVETMRHAFDDLRTTVELNGGGRTYAVGVQFDVEVIGTLLDRSNKPYVKQPGDDVKLWVDMAGTVERIGITTTKIRVP